MSKARNLIMDFAEAMNKDVVNRALEWWNSLPPDKQKEFMSNITAEKVSQIYRDLYGTSPTSASASEDMSKTKKIITAAALAAFLLASSPAHAGSPTQADYDKYDKMRSYQQNQPSKGQQEYSQEQGGGSPSLSSVADVAKRTIDTYGNPRTAQRTDKVSKDIEFVKSVLDTLSGR